MHNYMLMGYAKKKSLNGTVLITILILTVLLHGCGAIKAVEGVTDLGRNATQVLDSAIAQLATQSGNWQTTLTDLERKLIEDGQTTLANEVTQIAQKGIATGGTELRCDADFIRTRMMQDLQRLVAGLTGKPAPILEPALCQVVPTSVDMGHLPSQLEFSGYDLNVNTQGSIDIVLKHNGGEESLNQWVATPTHYLKTLSLSAVPLCDKENRKVVMRYGSKELSSVNVERNICPGADPRPARQPARNLGPTVTDAGAGGLGGSSFNREYGDRCTPGYERFDKKALKVEGGGSCQTVGNDPRTGERLGWVDDDIHNCKIRVHYGIPALQGVKCDITIQEIGEEPPAPVAPACNCW